MAAFSSATAAADAPLKVTTGETSTKKVAGQKRKRTGSQGFASTAGFTDPIIGGSEAKTTADTKKIKMKVDATEKHKTALHPRQKTYSDGEESETVRMSGTPSPHQIGTVGTLLKNPSSATPEQSFALFRFPQSTKSAGRYKGKEVNMRQLRIALNEEAGRPWDNPMFLAEYKAIWKWQAETGVTFVPGTEMAVYDRGHEGVF